LQNFSTPYETISIFVHLRHTQNCLTTDTPKVESPLWLCLFFEKVLGEPVAKIKSGARVH
jgi:hypothetical protein